MADQTNDDLTLIDAPSGTTLTRREAIKSAIVLAGAFVAGCGDDSSSDDDTGQQPVDGGSDIGTDIGADTGGDTASRDLVSDTNADTGHADTTASDTNAVDTAEPDVIVDPDGWKLQAGHFMPAKMPLVIATPRPADEIGPDSTYGWAHEGVRYEVPVGVIGGAWPFRYELVDAPTGMTIGSTLAVVDGVHTRTPDYGVVSWTPPAGSQGQSFSYSVRVTDQEDNTVEVAVTIVVDNAKFLFIAPDDGTANGDGTLEEPLRGFSAMFLGLASDATYAGRLAYFRGGGYVTEGGTDSNNNARLGGATKPKVWRAFPDEQPVFDCSGSKVIFNGGAMDDCCFEGIRWENGNQDVNNAHFIWATTAFNRGLFWRNHFFHLDKGLVGNDNPAAIFLNAAGSHRMYPVVLSNLFEEMGEGGGNGVAGYDSYGNDYALFENNEARNCTSSYCLWLKGGHRFTTVRGERGTENNVVGILLNIMLGQDGGTQVSESVEVTYCRVHNESTSGSQHSLRFHWATTSDENTDIWIYRNTVQGGVGALQRDTAEVTLERNVFTTTELPEGVTTVYVDNVTVMDADLDGELALQGAARASSLGVHGAEIA